MLDDEGVRRAIELLGELMPARDGSVADLERKAAAAREALRALDVDPGLVDRILAPPPPARLADSSQQVMEEIWDRLADLGYTPATASPPTLPEISFEELERRVRQAIGEALAAYGEDAGGVRKEPERGAE
ncbi:MAG TPA: hypothetical protein VOA87_14700 [Thermoanaerobaculia bacterium]|nr:hypothetical protein [Thermoanaerobaculia bacterium]